MGRRAGGHEKEVQCGARGNIDQTGNCNGMALPATPTIPNTLIANFLGEGGRVVNNVVFNIILTMF